MTHHSCHQTASKPTFSQSNLMSAEPSPESDDTPGDALLLRHHHPSLLLVEIKPPRIGWIPAVQGFSFDACRPAIGQQMRTSSQLLHLRLTVWNRRRAKCKLQLKTSLTPSLEIILPQELFRMIDGTFSKPSRHFLQKKGILMPKKSHKHLDVYKNITKSRSGQQHIRNHKKNNRSAFISLLNTLGGIQLYV